MIEGEVNKMAYVEDGKREVNEVVCIDCGSCASVCPVSCISQV